jgi:hypothetical protein
MRDEENNISIEYPVTGLDLSKYSYQTHISMYMIYTRSVITWGVCHTDTITYISRTRK